jgi:hypothetical protein
VNFQNAMKAGDTVDKVFATIDLALAIASVAGVGVSMTNTTGRTGAIGGALWQRVVARQQGARWGAVTVFYEVGEGTTTGVSSGTGLPRNVSPQVMELLKSLEECQTEFKKQYPMGACGEADAGSRIKLPSSGKLNQAWAATTKVKIAERIPACSRCGPFLQELGIRDAVALSQQPDMIPLVLLVSALIEEAQAETTRK